MMRYLYFVSAPVEYNWLMFLLLESGQVVVATPLLCGANMLLDPEEPNARRQ